ncbi:hypothetical protein CRE_20894 [Caenorhabditis remanei]|uniref:Uncharacterized protein n=1 Tax=Caenorhabditis remanei TaxID=31234 RepID=E3MV57_CAERE|nr:hypothetical protein CRE_20894 [Caenorhabditis remanei]
MWQSMMMILRSTLPSLPVFQKSPIPDSNSVRDIGFLAEPDLKFRAHTNRTVAQPRLRSSQILKSLQVQ